ncbi:hypothetical protein C0995_011429 [Termitomyces sp. Mi166|nr:hypothetical protein C0995_011429 [Termitomyces sp. Mi166\
MAAVHNISIVQHTTVSSPRPHVLYLIKADFRNGHEYEVLRRYSQFVGLHEYLGDTFVLPPKRIVLNAMVSSAWIDDGLIAERKAGLADYLNQLNMNPRYQNNNVFLQFLSSSSFDVNNLPVMAREAPVMSYNMLAYTQALSPKPQAANVAAAYYPTWSTYNNPPDTIDFAKFDILFFAFALPNASATLDWNNGSQSILRNLVSNARRSGKGTKIVLSIGWGGSRWFSDAVKSTTNRTKLNNTLVNVVNSFGLDGAGNSYRPTDSTNLLSFLKLLRASLGPAKIISAAVAHLPWLGSDGKPLTDVTEFAAVMTYVNIMNYDVNVASSKPGPNAPLGDLCGTSANPRATAQSAFKQWTKAGFPASKLLLGLALYGYVSKSTATRLSGSSTSDLVANSVEHLRGPPKKSSAAPAGDLSGMWGQQIAFNQIVHSGVLQKRDDGIYTAAHGYTQGWDDCSDTPVIFLTTFDKLPSNFALG